MAFGLQLGCDFTELTANGTSKLFKRASPAIEQHWDYDLVGEALPGSITQLEGIHKVVPENELIIEQLVRGYVSYTFGWVEDEIEQVELEGDYERVEALSYRARLLYQRARDLALYWIALDDEGLDEKMNEGLGPFEAWLEANFDEEEDAAKLLWAGYAWGSMINMAKDDMSAVADLPYAIAMVQRSVELDPTYFNSAGLTFLGVAESMGMSTDLEKAKGYFDQALKVTEGKVLVVQLNYAKAYAVKAQDRELFDELLTEVVEAGDVSPENRLANMIAKRRAARYLEHPDMFF
ncbi:MAG: TRAP transporter TatT component family protein [Myxococcota bacterium]